MFGLGFELDLDKLPQDTNSFHRPSQKGSKCATRLSAMDARPQRHSITDTESYADVSRAHTLPAMLLAVLVCVLHASAAGCSDHEGTVDALLLLLS